MRTDNLFHWECPQAPLIVVFPNPLLVDAWNPLSYGYAALLQLCLTGFDGLLSRAESDSKGTLKSDMSSQRMYRVFYAVQTSLNQFA